jgi:hypothetical protein
VPSTSTSARSKPAGIWARAPLPLAGQRPNEIAVRVALGGQRSSIVRIVIGEGLRLSLGGIGFRLLGTIALARLMRSLLFEVSPNDPITFTGVVALLVPWLSAPATFPRIVRHTAIRWSFSVVTRSNTLASSSTVEAPSNLACDHHRPPIDHWTRWCACDCKRRPIY